MLFYQPGYVIGGIIATTLAVCSVAVAIKFKTRKNFLRILVAFWTLVPPIYFFFEFHLERQSVREREVPHGTVTHDETQQILADMKDSQEQAARIWTALSIVLAVIFLKKDD